MSRPPMFIRQPARIAAIFVLLLLGNAAAWLWAAALFQGDARLLGMALLAYGLGLRHAVDPDHIAAIDNVTRKLMQDGQRPVTVGLFFALGHSSVVALAALVVGMAAGAVDLGRFKEIGAMVGSSVSALFLLTIAAMNLVVLKGVLGQWRRRHDGGAAVDAPAIGGPLGRLLQPLFRLISGPWLMLPLGVLFGLGFDTATEVGLLSLSAKGAVQGLPLAAMMAFPALFTAGMALVDAADGVLMVAAYGWAFVRPERKLLYNLTVTTLSVLVAIVIGGYEAWSMLRDQFGLAAAWPALDEKVAGLGLVTIGLLAACWLASLALARRSRPECFSADAAPADKDWASPAAPAGSAPAGRR